MDFFFFLCFFDQRFHTETDLAVFDSDDFYINFIAYVKNSRRSFDTLIADLGNVYQSGETIADADESSVSLK